MHQIFIIYKLNLSPTLNYIEKETRKLTKRLASEMPGLTIGDTIPDLVADSTHGKIKLHDYIGASWTIIFSHPG
jgi:hypothetical protein